MISEESILEFAVDVGADECISKEGFHEIFCAKENFYKVKTAIEKQINNFLNSGIEWHPLNKIELKKEEEYRLAVNLLEALENDDDVQNVYTNLEEKKLN